MKHCAIVFTAPGKVELVPQENQGIAPGPGEVSGATVASLVSAGTELALLTRDESFPFHPGYASVFRVEAIGEGVENIEVGDFALAMGNHCSHQKHPVRDIWPVPRGLAPGDAAFARLMGVSMSTLVTTTARPADKVLVTGLGPVGHLAAQMFQAAGYNVLGYDPDGGRRQLAVAGGVRQVCEILPFGEAQWEGKFALVVECSGHEQSALDACRLVRPRGEVVLIGCPWRKRTDLSAHDLLHAIFHKYVVVRSGWEWEVPRHETDFRCGSIQANISAALEWLRDGRVRVSGHYSTYQPSECQAAYDALLAGREKQLAVVFDWTKLTD